MKRILTAIFLFATGFCLNVKAEILRLPDKSKKMVKEIEKLCPDCLKDGFIACGKNSIQYGKNFSSNFFYGKPKKGFLVSPGIKAEDFRSSVRVEKTLKELEKKIKQRFLNLKLVIFSDDFAEVELIPEPSEINIVFPEKLFNCLQDKRKLWGCCVASCLAEEECCEKSLGSPKVEVVWNKPSENEEVKLIYASSIGNSVLERRINSEKTIYFCLTDSVAFLE